MIQVKNVCFQYPGTTQQAVKSINFTIGEGEIFGFLGPSGAGKSTTQKILIRLLTGYTGEIRILHKSLSEWNSTYYDHIGVGFELPNHYLKLTALENLQFFATFYNRPTQNPMHLLEMVNLHDHAHKKVEDFSKGMKMRLNFVRALLHNPDILFLDEPTSGLDPVNARIMKDCIMDLRKQGKTIFITTHNMHDADELCDRVAFMVNGEIKQIGSPKQLKLQASKQTVRVEYLRERLYTETFPLEGLGDNMAFISLLKQEQIQAIHSEEASLEEVFIHLTGATLV